MKAVAKVDPRFLSYNVEMAEVTGAPFWAPYGPDGTPPRPPHQKREPVDLKGNTRLRNLAKALGPAYMRVSGTWANSTWFQDDDRPAGPVPSGFKGVLTRAQWAGVAEFARAVDARVVTSFGVSPGTRGRDGTWNPANARALMRFDRALGGNIVAVETVNEPTFAQNADLPAGYDAARFAEDNRAVIALVRREAPQARIVGPSATGDVANFIGERGPYVVATDVLLGAPDKPGFDVFSYHFYTSASSRCVPAGRAAKPEQGLTSQWLGMIDTVDDYYTVRRDRHAPGAPVWVTELGQAACGGDRWAASFADSFRYVDNMARTRPARGRGGVPQHSCP